MVKGEIEITMRPAADGRWELDLPDGFTAVTETFRDKDGSVMVFRVRLFPKQCHDGELVWTPTDSRHHIHAFPRGPQAEWEGSNNA